VTPLSVSPFWMARATGAGLAQSLILQYGTRDVYELARHLELTIETARWPLVTVGEWDARARTIHINQAALDKAQAAGIAVELAQTVIVAHELGHARAATKLEKSYPTRELNEILAHTFVLNLLQCMALLERLETIWRDGTLSRY
jgi:hypothetical protein